VGETCDLKLQPQFQALKDHASHSKAFEIIADLDFETKNNKNLSFSQAPCLRNFAG
jgi:hypothetical protein